MFVSFEFLGLQVFSKCLILCLICLSVGQIMCPHNPGKTHLSQFTRFFSDNICPLLTCLGKWGGGGGGGSPKVDIVYFFTVIHTKASLNVFVNVIVIVITLINVSKVTSV